MNAIEMDVSGGMRGFLLVTMIPWSDTDEMQLARLRMTRLHSVENGKLVPRNHAISALSHQHLPLYQM